MLKTILKIFDGNEREVSKIKNKYVKKINDLADSMKKASDEELAGKTAYFKEKLERGASLDDILVEAFAVVREVSQRTLGLRPFDVQLIGGTVLHQGRISEMKTGEGKTLVATMPAYLNALAGKGVHVVTVNDYLAKRDSEWMGPIYKFLNLSVGLIQHDLNPPERKEAYLCDITYGTNNEYGFDYLRDNMVLSIDDCVLRELNYAIIDEVDSILIDEARTPLIISGMGVESTSLYSKFSRVAAKLTKGIKVSKEEEAEISPQEKAEREKDYTVDEKAHSVMLTERGIAKAEELISISNIYDDKNIELLHHLNVALKAKELFHLDVEYVIKDGEIIIVDEFTGRLMYGRRYSDGIHQAIEAKERVKIQQEDQTLATITFQNYFRLYKKISGMTGTAATEEDEFRKIYKLDVVVIPTNKPMVRKDHSDIIYRSEKAKFNGVIEEIEQLYNEGRPVLVGTRSIEKSETLSSVLKTKKIPHNVLNAKYHAMEAEIIAQAGQPQAVTIATNMAGRGVDIVLGEGVAQKGGLHIIGSERHESRRIDNQLRGRSGRQGDPGSSRFYVSLEDELMRLFGSDKISSMLDSVGVDEETYNRPLAQYRFLSSSIERAQKKVEAHNFEIRKTVLDYDDVMEKQRAIIYGDRQKILRGEDTKSTLEKMAADQIDHFLGLYLPEQVEKEQWEYENLAKAVQDMFATPKINLDELKIYSRPEIKEHLLEQVKRIYSEKEAHMGELILRNLERFLMLQVIDSKWIDHLQSMDALKEGIGLRAYGQKDPRIEYQIEAYDMFLALMESIREDVLKFLFHIQTVTGEEERKKKSAFQNMHTNREEGEESGPPSPHRVKKIKVNAPCPCGSGKKYKKCCGRS